MAGGGGRTSHVKATLSIHEPPAGDSTTPGGTIRKIAFQFNPAQLEISRSAQWTYTPTVASREAGRPEFLGTDQQSLDLEMFLDCSDKPGDSRVRTAVEALFSCLKVVPSSLPDRPSPPWVILEWGKFSTVRFVAYVRQAAASYTLFDATGEPIRATCRISLEEIPHATAGQNPTSGALSARRVHRVVAGDSLASLAWREYGDATAWRIIAEANDLDDPMRLPPGRELLLPAADELHV
ncbi:LysM peptidoglycan-binding domain-containing protein [Actinomadura oligospora]|uniref:CIS tube protein n=1 Tax=Actinomadura oligospora TaxID=111804 RepID=UPI00047DA52C|nr:LysM peptidoglycan-binding domain-containing protein [Actinomadura oligospora]